MRRKVEPARVHKLIALWLKWPNDEDDELAKRVYQYNVYYDWAELNKKMTAKLNSRGYNFCSIIHEQEAENAWIAEGEFKFRIKKLLVENSFDSQSARISQSKSQTTEKTPKFTIK